MLPILFGEFLREKTHHMCQEIGKDFEDSLRGGQLVELRNILNE